MQTDSGNQPPFRETGHPSGNPVSSGRFRPEYAIVRYDLETFIEQAWEVVGRKVFKRQWLCDLYRTAEESVALPLKEDSLAVETYRMVLRQYRDVNRLR